jgi:hypothetical protein
VVTLLGACSNIIGISSYEIDPSLGNSSGGSHAGSKNMSGGEPSTPVGGDDSGGSTSTGGKPAGGSSSGSGGSGTVAAGEAGMSSAGEPSTGECKTAADCDDTIDCTTDTCSAGACVHTPKNTLCDSTMCQTCKAGIGCVAGPKTIVQLLEDPGFDILPATGDWDESSSDGVNIVTNVAAQSPTKSAQFGPGPSVGTDLDNQQYSDVYQYLTIPVGTVAINLTGFYKLTAGANSPKDDYLLTAFFQVECPDPDVDPNADPDCSLTKPFTEFHSFRGTTGATTTWKAFSYSAPKADVAKMGGVDYTFDLVAHVWDTEFQLDSLQMNATVCQ